MKERIKTLLLDANGYGWKAIAADTVLQGILKLSDTVTFPSTFDRVPIVSTIAKAFRHRYETLSYVNDWREALCSSRQLEVEVCNINNLMAYHSRKKAIADYPLVIILHAAAGDSMSLLLKTAHWFQKRRGILVVFIGNEYDLLAEKITFLRSVEADYVCSQLPIDTARWLYAECGSSRVLTMPHALNPNLYHHRRQIKRSIDIGFRGAFYYGFIGDVERNTLVRFFQDRGADLGLMCDVRAGNIPRFDWARFLNQCKGTVGAEAGSYYLDRKGKIIADAKAYLFRHRGVSFEELFHLFFKSPQVEYRSGKSISSRHFEPIGTKTCQILLEGNYNGIFQSDVDYISLKKDLSNIHEAIDMFRDTAYRKEMADRAYEYAMSEHTYGHRVKGLMKAVINNHGSNTRFISG